MSWREYQKKGLQDNKFNTLAQIREDSVYKYKSLFTVTLQQSNLSYFKVIIHETKPHFWLLLMVSIFSAIAIQCTYIL